MKNLGSLAGGGTDRCLSNLPRKRNDNELFVAWSRWGHGLSLSHCLQRRLYQIVGQEADEFVAQRSGFGRPTASQNNLRNDCGTDLECGGKIAVLPAGSEATRRRISFILFVLSRCVTSDNSQARHSIFKVHPLNASHPRPTPL